MAEARPRYRIQAVSRMTSVPAPTLRAWERRYGIPRPQRTDSAYRLYSDQDIEQIRRLRGYCEQGMAPSEAAAMIARQAEPPSPAPEAQTRRLHERLVDAVERYDEQAIQALLSQALLGGSAAQIYDDIISPTMREVGDRWHRGELTVGQEHLATAHLETTARALLRLAQPTAPVYTVLLACCADEQHSLPLYGAALHFAGWGFRAVVLGANTPPTAVAQGVAGAHPDLVGLSLTGELSQSQAGPVLTAYAEACVDTPWLLGGAGAAAHEALVKSLGGRVAPAEAGPLRGLVDEMIRKR